MACLRECDVILLAGGLGRRLQPLFPGFPKVLVPVNGRPFLDYLLTALETFGARRVILALGYGQDIMLRYVKERAPSSLEIVCSIEPSPLGTAGALRWASPRLRADTVLVMNGDSFTRVDLCRFAAFHRAGHAWLSMLLTSCERVDRYARVETNSQGIITRFHARAQGGSGFINAGVYLMDRSVITERMPTGRPVSFEEEIIPALCREGARGFQGAFPFIDIGTPASYAAAGAFFQPQALAARPISDRAERVAV